MPKTVYDSSKLASMVDLLYYHEHANGDISEIQGKVENIQVHFAKRDAAVDFIILKSTNQGNIVLGRTFLRAMKGFIDLVGYKVPMHRKYVRLKGVSYFLLDALFCFNSYSCENIFYNLHA